jgi:hypothetical protein
VWASNIDLGGKGSLVQEKASKSHWIIECLKRALDGEMKEVKVGKKERLASLA